MKIFRLFTIAAAALMMVACSSEDLTQQAQTKAGKMQFSATIAAPNSGAGTRTEYTEDTENKKITVAWKVGDEIALVHDKVMDVVKVKTVNADGSATIDGTITSATDEATVQLVYPAARVSAVNSDGNPEFNETVSGKLLTQDGTLTYIQNNIDFREGEGQLSVNGTEVTLNAAVDMVSSIAIWKLTLQNDAATPAALAATKVTIKGKFTSEGQDEDLASTTELSPGASTVYLAVPAATGDITGDICITATTADNDYFYMKEGVALEAKKYYQSTVQMTKGAHLAFLSADYEAKDGAILTGTLNGAQKITIADGATVTLDGVTINGVHSDWYQYAGITCLGDATIILKDGTTNTVTGFDGAFPGIQGAAGKTLTITGTGSLNAASGGTGAGIGSGAYSNNYAERACGDIVIEGGTITATGGSSAAGIGSGRESNCGAITISGGTVTATGGQYGAGIGSGLGEGNQSSTGKCGDILISGGTVEATGGSGAAGIGSGYDGANCGTITITTGVTQVTATSDGSLETVGRGGNGYCTNVTIAGTVYWNGSAYQNGGDTYLTQSTIVYPTPSVALSAVTSTSYLGWRICSDGKAYAAAGPLPSGVTAVAMIAYVGNGSNCTHGLAIQLNASPESMNWSAACSYSSYPSITGNPGTWRLPSKADWQNMFVGCAVSGDASASDNMDPIAGFKAKIAATGITWKSGSYWSSTESGSKAWDVYVELGYANASFAAHDASTELKVLGCLAF